MKKAEMSGLVSKAWRVVRLVIALPMVRGRRPPWGFVWAMRVLVVRRRRAAGGSWLFLMD